MKSTYEKMGYDESRQIESALRMAKRKALRTPSHAYAYSVTSGNLKGIFINNKFKAPELISSIKRDIASNFHPLGITNEIKSIFDHEMGHQLSDLVKASSNSEIKDLFIDVSKRDAFKSEISGYASKNISEFIAESWSEFRNSPTPRPIAKKVGSILTSLYSEMFGG